MSAEAARERLIEQQAERDYLHQSSFATLRSFSELPPDVREDWKRAAAIVVDAVLASDDVLEAKGGVKAGSAGSPEPRPLWVFPSSVPNKEERRDEFVCACGHPWTLHARPNDRWEACAVSNCACRGEVSGE